MARQVLRANPEYRGPCRKKGVALLLVIIAMAMAAILVVSFQSSQTTATAVAKNIKHHADARSIAESALVLAVEYVRTSDTWRDDQAHGQWATDVSLYGGTYSLWGEDGWDEDADGTLDPDETDGDLADDASDYLTLTVVATYDGVTHHIQTVITPGTSDAIGDLLFIVPDADNPSSRDEDKTERFEQWGWDVTYLDANASQGDYDDAVAEHDVVYITEDVNSGHVGSKLTDASIGVVCEEGYLFDDLEITSSNGGDYNSTTIDITDNSHYITSPFSTGSLTVGSSSVSMRQVSGTLAAGAQSLAERPGTSTPTLVVLDTGETRSDGDPSTGRRVAMAFGGGSFNINTLNDDGLTLLERAIAWAGNATGSSPGLLAEHFIADSSPSILNDIDWDDDPDYTEVVEDINYPSTGGSFYSGGPSNNFGVRFTGYIDIPTDGTWTFYLNSDDGSDFVINGDTLIDNDGLHGMVEESASIALTAGKHPIAARVFERGGGAGVILSWAGPGVSKQVVPASAFSYGSGGSEATGEEPTLLAEYTFDEPDVEPTLVGHWKLDEAPAAGGGQAGLSVEGDITISGSVVIDSYDSSLGTYGGANKGEEAYVATNATGNNDVALSSSAKIKGDVHTGPGSDPDDVIATWGSSEITGDTAALDADQDFTSISDPAGMPSKGGNITLNGSDTVTLTDDEHWNKLTMSSDSKLIIDGNVRLKIHNTFAMTGNSEIELTPGSTLELYCGHNADIDSSCKVNDSTKDPSRLSFYMLGNNRKFQMTSSTQFYGRVFNPDGAVEMWSSAEFFGTIQAKEFATGSSVKIHIDTSLSGSGGGGGGGAVGPAADETDNDNHGAYDSATPGQTGQLDNAAEFDGNDDYIEIDHHEDYEIDSGSISLWFKADDLIGSQAIFSKDSNNYDDGGHLHIYTDNATLKAQLQSTSASYELTENGLAADTWHHVVVQWGVLGMKLYLDGTLVDEDDYTGGIADNDEPIALGAGTSNSGDGSVTPINNYFEGLIDDVRIYDGLLDQNQVTNLAAGAEPGARTAPSYLVEDTSGYATPLNLYIKHTDDVAWVGGGGLTFTGATIAQSPDAATKLHTAITETDAFTVEVKFTPDTISTGGGTPKRIVSYSADNSNRNFSVGQDDADYMLSLRTDDTGSNGTPDLEADVAMAADTVQHVILSYDGENVTLYRNGTLEATLPRTGDLDNWNDAYTFMLANETSEDRAFIGTFHRVAIYDDGVDSGQADNIFGGLPPGPPSSGGGGDATTFSTRWVEP